MNASSEASDENAQERDYRNKNKDIVKEAEEKLADIGTFKPWMPGKERDSVEFSNISGWHTWSTGWVLIAR